VSVVVPCHNYARYLRQCVVSALEQPGVDVEVLIIDDASSDDTSSVGHALAADPRVTVRRHAENCGHIATYNEGLAWARGDLTVLLSADDVLIPGSLARAATVFSAYSGVGMVYGNVVRFGDGAGVPAAKRRSNSIQVWSGVDWIAACCSNGRVPVTSPEVVVRTPLQHRLGGYRPELPHSGDHEMWLRFAAHADIAYVNADQAGYRVHGDNMSRQRFHSVVVDAEQRRRAFEAALPHNGDGIRHAALYRAALHGLADEMLWHAARGYDKRFLSEAEIRELVARAVQFDPSARRRGNYTRLRVRRLMGPHLAPMLAPLWLPDLIRHRIVQSRREFGRMWWRHLL
jgi:glycosyltransferase involved in cell wall biosynthesis